MEIFKLPVSQLLYSYHRKYREQGKNRYCVYEVLRGQGQYDIIIEYLSVKNKKEIKNIFKKLKLIFNSFQKCRLILDTKKKNTVENKKSSKVLVFYSDTDLAKELYFFDSFLRQGYNNLVFLKFELDFIKAFLFLKVVYYSKIYLLTLFKGVEFC